MAHIFYTFVLSQANGALTQNAAGSRKLTCSPSTWVSLFKANSQRIKSLPTIRVCPDLFRHFLRRRSLYPGSHHASVHYCSHERRDGSIFFTSLRAEIDKGKDSALSQVQREGLRSMLISRDEIITLLARSDPASADRLSDLYVSYRKSMSR